MTDFMLRVASNAVLATSLVLAMFGVAAGQNPAPDHKQAEPSAGRPHETSPIDHFRRTREWERVEEYMGEETYYNRSVGRWFNKPENRTKTWDEGARELGLRRPESDEAYNDALDVMIADPTDDLGFMAILFCMKFTEKNEPLNQCSDHALSYLDRDYTNDPRMEHVLLILARAAGARGEAMLDKVIDQSTDRGLRAEAAYWLVEEKHNDADDAALSAADRNARREKMLRLSHLLEQRYGDVIVWAEKPIGELIKPILFSLEQLSLGEVMPDMKVRRVDGSEDDLKNYRGKVVLLDYWATWCIPCVKSLRENVTPLKKELQGKPFEVITLSIDDKPAAVDEFTKNVMPLPFVNWFIGTDSTYYRPWGLSGVPHYYLLDKHGVIRANTYEAETLVETAKKLAQE